MRRLSKGLAQPGMDDRYWVSYGTVGVMSEDGEFDPTDPHAIYNGPEGVEVEVLLEPLGIPCVCVYAGIYGGRKCTIFAPIKAGDRVLVGLPGGDPSAVPVIIAVLHNAEDVVPLGEDRKPVFRNDRLFVWIQDGPIDIRTKDGGKVLIEQDGTITVTCKKSVLNASDESDITTKKHVVTADATHLGADLGVAAALTNGVVLAQGIDPFTGLSYGGSRQRFNCGLREEVV